MQVLPFSLQPKDVIGPVISFVAMLVSFTGAAVSFFYYKKNYALSKQNADRSIYMDGQKFLIEICKQLTAEPLLWCVYDDNALHAQFSKEVSDVKFKAKLLAFGHLHLNMFEIVLAEAPNPEAGKPGNHSTVWVNYFQDTMSRSHLIRKILQEPESGKIWSPVLLDQYAKWKDLHPDFTL
ncbi:MAG TPA: hypothetical protein VHW24_00260 [Bryobacteraceae bacterium]|jgi:hypothetical protein|nr:hypothetical protein [Bryobacteraceae bacterium]